MAGAKVEKVSGITYIVLTLVAMALTSCSGPQQTKIDQATATTQATHTSSGTTDSDNTPEASGLELVQQAVTNMKNVESLHFEVRESIPGLIDASEGDYVRPDKARGILHSSQRGEVKWMLWGRDYLEETPGTDTYRPTGLGAPTGIHLEFEELSSIVPHIESATTIVTDEIIDGIHTSYVVVVYNATDLPGGGFLTSQGKGRFDVSISRETKYIYQLGFSPSESESPYIFNHYSKFNQPISPPLEFPKSGLPHAN